jgi:3-oxoadipate enol-lactonase
VNGLPFLAHRVDGDGPPLLLLNGGLMSIASWDKVAAALARSRRVVRCDLRGQLLSPGPPPPTLEGHAADVVALLDRLGLERADVVGTSFGALVGVLLAASAPERVRSLVAVTATDRLEAQDWAEAQPLLEAALSAARGGDGGRVLDLLLESAYSPAFLAANRAALLGRRSQVAALPPAFFAQLAGLLHALEGLDLRPRLAAVRCPALVVAAELDRTFPMERSADLARALPCARLELVAGSGHALVAEAPERLLAVLEPFLDAVSAAGGTR